MMKVDFIFQREFSSVIDFFLDSSWKKSTAPEMCFNSLISVQKKYPDLAIWTIFYDHFSPTDWNQLINKWKVFWKNNKENIYWDSKDRFFRIEGNDLQVCQ